MMENKWKALLEAKLPRDKNRYLREIIYDFIEDHGYIDDAAMAKMIALAQYIPLCLCAKSSKIDADAKSAIRDVIQSFAIADEIPYSFISFLILHKNFTLKLSDSEALDSNREDTQSVLIERQYDKENEDEEAEEDEIDRGRGEVKSNKGEVDYNKRFEEIKNHTYLAFYEKKYAEAKEGVIEMSASLEKFNVMEDKIEDIDNRLSNNTANYIAILSIFSAVIFSFMGGITLFDKSAQYINDMDKFSTYIAVGLFVLFLIVSFLLLGVDFLKRFSKWKITIFFVFPLLPLAFLLLKWFVLERFF